MTGNKKRIIYLFLGLCAGLTGFSAVELLSAAGVESYLFLAITQGASLGLIFGFIFGFTDAIFYKELKRGLIKAGIAAGLGGLTAAAAVIFSSQGMLWTANIFKLEYEQTMGLLFPLWRGVGWMFMGMFIGAVDGIQRKTWRRGVAGGLGGLAGGLLGGLIFEFLVRFFPEAALARAFGLIAMGLLIGLFLGEFEIRFSYARLRVLNGQLKDREFLLVKPKVYLGDSIHDDVYIHGYRKILSGLILRKNSEIYLEPGDESPLLLNDEPAGIRQALKYQDVIQLGDVKLLYLPL
ncbi:MAG: hypothetical protein JEY99_13820 [Spirochaetales bacterium]|nr:hypothetical protein [Spirochaetales bacterium]